MTARMRRNARVVRLRDGFHISRKPIVRPATGHHAHYAADAVRLPRGDGPPILFAIARDPRTIFASWSVDWQSAFEKNIPVNRQVHLRVCRADGLEEMRVVVEPMASTQYVTRSDLDGPYRLEIGYYQPADVWHLIATSNEVLMPSDRIAEYGDLDVATVPLHLRFQQLHELFGAKTAGTCATEISKFQKKVLSKAQEALTTDERQLLAKLGVSLSDIEISRRNFSKSHRDKFARRVRTLVTADSTSPTSGSRSRSSFSSIVASPSGSAQISY